MKKEQGYSLRSGFTMIELMIVIAIIAALAALVGPALIKNLGKSKVTTTQANMTALKAALQDYYSDMGHFPTKSEKGLQALVERPRGPVGKKWEGPYLEGKTELPLDGWDADFEYNSPPVKFKQQYRYYEIISYGDPSKEGQEPLSVGA